MVISLSAEESASRKRQILQRYFLACGNKQRAALHTAALKGTGKDGRVRQSVDLL